MIDKNVLLRMNNWWETKRVRADLAKPFKREIFFKVLDYLPDRQIIEITGLRRVGKTTLFFQIIEKILQITQPRNILYFSFDEEISSIKEIVNFYEKEILTKKLENNERIYIFLDEIQKCQGWERELKIFYDLYPNVKFFISGSASLLIDKRAKESLAGRVFSFLMEPLSFKEFLKFKGIEEIEEENLTIFERTLSIEFYDYLKKGGFPEIVFKREEEKIRNYIKNNVVEKIIYKDLPEAFGIKDFELLKSLLEIFSKNSGMILNVDNLSKNLKRNRITLNNYLYYLQFSLLLKLVLNLRENFLVTSRKMKKVYATTPSLIFAYEDIREENLPRYLETFVCNQLGISYYFRNKFEIDFILKNKKIIPIEVKNKVTERDIFDFEKRIKRINLDKGFIITKDQKIEKNKIKVIPAYYIGFYQLI